MKKNGLISALLISALLLACAGCGKKSDSDSISIDDIVISGPDAAGTDESTASLTYASDGDTQYSSALYLLFMQDAFGEIQSAYEDLDYTQVLDTDVTLDDGSTQKGAERISSYADEEFKWLYVIDKLYRESGLTPEDSTFYNQSVYYAGQTYKDAPDYYKYFGITMSDLLLYYIYSYEYNDLFYHMYGEGGEKEIAESDLESVMDEGAYRIQYIYLPYYDTETSEALSSSDISQRRDMAQDFLDRYNAGEDFEDLVYENYCFLDPATTRTDTTSYDYFIAKSGGSFPTELVDAAASLSDGQAKMVETGDFAAVVLRLPVNGEHSASWRSAALQLAYDKDWGSEFNIYMLDEYNSAQIDYNEDAKTLLTPECYVKLLEGYYSQAATETAAPSGN